MKIKFGRSKGKGHNQQICSLPEGCGEASAVREWTLFEQRLDSKGDLRRVTMQCPRCGKRWTMYYTNKEIRALMKQQEAERNAKTHMLSVEQIKAAVKQNPNFSEQYTPEWNARAAKIKELMGELNCQQEPERFSK